jgi:hypothetical protein
MLRRTLTVFRSRDLETEICSNRACHHSRCGPHHCPCDAAHSPMCCALHPPMAWHSAGCSIAAAADVAAVASPTSPSSTS